MLHSEGRHGRDIAQAASRPEFDTVTRGIGLQRVNLRGTECEDLAGVSDAMDAMVQARRPDAENMIIV